MSFTPTEEIPFCSREHRKRVMDALRHRLYPNTSMHPKQLAGYLGVTPRTIANWMDGSTGLSSEHFGKLFALFGVSFYVEVYGPIGAAVLAKAERIKRAEEERARSEERILKQISGVAA